VEEGKVKTKGLYIHFPFCKRFCFYCHFTKFKHDDFLEDKYINYLIKELNLRKGDYLIDTIYFGGGSPSIINKNLIEKLVNFIFKNFKISKGLEFTIEVNPEDSSSNLFEFYKNIGINRVSLGTQSFDDSDLKFLRRTHNLNDNIKALEMLKSIGFSNINIDLIIALPFQDFKSIDNSIKYIKDFDINHVSSYILEEINLDIDEKFIEDIYFYTRKRLIDIGFNHYEVSNFSKKGYESKHNLKYWTGKEYIGAGVSSSGYENGVDYKNHVDFDNYFKSLDSNNLPVLEKNEYSNDYRRIITGLRLFNGIDKRYFNNYEDILQKMIDNGFLLRENDLIRINPDYILILNEILSNF